jgi:hypothetical protein
MDEGEYPITSLAGAAAGGELLHLLGATPAKLRCQRPPGRPGERPRGVG